MRAPLPSEPSQSQASGTAARLQAQLRSEVLSLRHDVFFYLYWTLRPHMLFLKALFLFGKRSFVFDRAEEGRESNCLSCGLCFRTSAMLTLSDRNFQI